MTSNNIRNFAIISHIDHGKSTLADRLLELTGTVPQREMRAQILDQMDLERERGITIKLQPVCLHYSRNNKSYILNLIDTPGHIDFTYEVSRSLASVEGVILLVDATQGIQAQTLTNLYLALEQNLTIIPVVNKIDLPNADREGVAQELAKLLGLVQEEIILASAKTGEGVTEILAALIKKIPPPSGREDLPFKALIFDSVYDEYKGVIVYVRVFDGQIRAQDKIKMIATKASSEVMEVGIFKPKLQAQDKLRAGEIGYIVTGLKEVSLSQVGDTVTIEASQFPPVKPLPGYKEIQPMVFAGIFPKEGGNYLELREAFEKLKLNDAALIFEPERSLALGSGFRCGFLGLLHLEIVQERLRREYDLDLITTSPSVAYKIYLHTKPDDFSEGGYQKNFQVQIIKSPQEMPSPAKIDHIEEPIMKLDVICPKEYLGPIMRLLQDKRGTWRNTEYLDLTRVILDYEVPLASILVDFYDKLKSVSSGYASLSYEFLSYRSTRVVKLDILVAREPVEALSTIVYEDSAYQVGRAIVKELKKVLPRRLFEVKLQAAIGSKIIASEKIPPLRKDVTAKLYGGDVTRKKKLLEKQKKGKKKMSTFGKVEIPPEAFLAVLKR